jgi:hypothetical protein
MPQTVLSLSLTFTLFLSGFSFAFAQDSITSLTNADIITMVKAKLPPALIIEKINTSSCNFDTFPSVLAELKYRGISDDVLMAMVHAPHGARITPERSATTSSPPSNGSVPGEVATAFAPPQSPTSAAPTNIGGMILRDHSETAYNARFFVAPMEEGFDGLISAIMLEKKLPLTITADENLADFIIVGGTNKGVQKWYDTVFGSGYERDRNQGSIRVIRVRDKSVIWGAQKGDRSFWWGALKKGGKRKVAERLVNEMKGDLFKGGF